MATHECKCGSTEFVSIITEEKTIEEFDERGKPITWKESKVISSKVLCRHCRNPDKIGSIIQMNYICNNLEHPHYFNDEQGPRCFCGARRDFKPSEIY